jgi:hypothetical protein
LTHDDNFSFLRRAKRDHFYLILDNQGRSVTNTAMLTYNFVLIEQNWGNNLGFLDQLGLYVTENMNLLPIQSMATKLL